jgi:hypothetical protein
MENLDDLNAGACKDPGVDSVETQNLLVLLHTGKHTSIHGGGQARRDTPRASKRRRTVTEHMSHPRIGIPCSR